MNYTTDFNKYLENPQTIIGFVFRYRQKKEHYKVIKDCCLLYLGKYSLNMSYKLVAFL